ncbi:uncharacterized protein LOC131431834 [Malaya genurostris]|uniref:uncharacterized protein LOC131431834 n=1 Tax=Malaya genurostris TaxID=325434 RepID=UPI0026F3B521|nr:uncharacterized protein LOC131431834 [Malaya genurostris]
MKGFIGVLVSVAVIGSLCSVPPAEGKNRNRVQKWQQRTWKARFGSAPKGDWMFDVPVKGRTHRRNLINDPQVPREKGHNGEKKDILLNQNGAENYRMKRFAFQENQDDDDGDDGDDEREQFTNDLANAPFVFNTDVRLSDDNDYSDEDRPGFNNDLVDFDFVRDDEGSVEFSPIQPGPNQRYVTVEERDPFPHAAPIPQGKNGTRKVQYTLIVHHEERNGAANDLRGSDSSFHCSLALVLAVLGQRVNAAHIRL